MNAEVIRVLPVIFDPYFKLWSIRLRSKCPRCKKVNKHGFGFPDYPIHVELHGYRGCDYCGLDYRIDWNG